MTIFWPALIIGVVFAAIGLLAWRAGERLARPMRDLQRNVNGERAASTITAKNLRWGAGALLVFGAVSIIASMLDLDW